MSITGCSSDGHIEDCLEGTADCPCYRDNTCNDGLECTDGMCVDPHADPGDNTHNQFQNNDNQHQNNNNQHQNNDNQNDEQPQECNPAELGADYPLDEPLDIDEKCDGQDNNCDGNVDIIFCDENENCPDDPEDPYGASLTFQCNTADFAPPRCEAFASDTLRCPEPIACLGAAGYEPVPNECGGEIPENQGENQGGD